MNKSRQKIPSHAYLECTEEYTCVPLCGQNRAKGLDHVSSLGALCDKHPWKATVKDVTVSNDSQGLPVCYSSPALHELSDPMPASLVGRYLPLRLVTELMDSGDKVAYRIFSLAVSRSRARPQFLSLARSPPIPSPQPCRTGSVSVSLVVTP